jgi:phosphoadenosine phosphosulfate reductase
MVDEAIDFMRANEPPEGYTMADSFGKDSTVLLELARMAGVRFVHIHNRTGIDPPELVAFGKRTRPNVIWIPPRMTMWEGIRKKFPPTIQQRWCCSELKKHKLSGLPTSILVGIRTEESWKRKSRPRISSVPAERIAHYKPIFHWSEWHVWEFIESMNLPYCHLYDEGFDRLGCCVCPMITSSSMAKVNQHRKRWPGFYKAFEHAVTWWFWNKAWWDRFVWKRPERFLDAWYRSFKTESSNSRTQLAVELDHHGSQLSFLNGAQNRRLS